MVKSAETRRNLHTHTHTHTHTCNPLLSLKQIGTICFVFSLILISQKSYSDIAANNSNPSCDNSTLNTYTGPAALEAKWNANTIQLKWYKDDELLTVQTAANQCTYDGTMTLPSTRPTKTGYDFNGWRVKAASGGNSGSSTLLCGLTDSILYGNASGSWTKGYYNDADYCTTLYSGADINYDVDCSTSSFSDLNRYEWKVVIGNDTFRGIASCNSTPGTDIATITALEESVYQQFMDGEITMEEMEAQFDVQYLSLPGVVQPAGTFNMGGSGSHCWCSATSYTPNGGNVCDVSSSSSWIYRAQNEDCAQNCATYCAGSFIDGDDYRNILFTQSN